MIVLLLSILIIIGLIAKEELQLNEEIVISISFILTVAIIKSMLKDTANETFKERSNEQEAVFIQKGSLKKSYYNELNIIVNVFEQLNIAGDAIFKENIKNFKNENSKLKVQLTNYIGNDLVILSNTIIESLIVNTLKNKKKN